MNRVLVLQQSCRNFHKDWFLNCQYLRWWASYMNRWVSLYRKTDDFLKGQNISGECEIIYLYLIMRFFCVISQFFKQLPYHLAEPFSVWLQWYSHIMVTPPQTVLPTFSLSSFFSFWTFPDLVFIGEGPRLPMSKFIKSLIYNMKKTSYLQHEKNILSTTWKKHQRLTKTSVK